MLLTLLRHAPAEDPEGHGVQADAARRLTPRGRRRLKRVREALRRADLRFGRLLFSPRARALESADVLMPLVEGPAHPEPLLAAPPGEPLLKVLAHLERTQGEASAGPLLVGHQPYLGTLAAWLVWGRRSLGGALDLKKGGLLVLEGEPRPRGMRLVALLPPGLLRRWGRS